MKRFKVSGEALVSFEGIIPAESEEEAEKIIFDYPLDQTMLDMDTLAVQFLDVEEKND